MGRPLLLDLFCGAGGAAAGYYLAGFDVIGVDLRPMPRYPYRFIQAEALEFLDWLLGHPSNVLGDLSAIHASPPCQMYSAMGRYRSPEAVARHPDLIGPVRERLTALGLPYAIENVGGAPLITPARLCGTAFGIPMHRHRFFECSFAAEGSACHRAQYTVDPYDKKSRAKYRARHGHDPRHDWHHFMGVPWMTQAETTEAIPPAYTEHIGRQMTGWLS